MAVLSSHLPSELSLSSHQIWTLTRVWWGQFFYLNKPAFKLLQLLQLAGLPEKGSPNLVALPSRWHVLVAWDVGRGWMLSSSWALGGWWGTRAPGAASLATAAGQLHTGDVWVWWHPPGRDETQASAIVGSLSDPNDFLGSSRCQSPWDAREDPCRKPVKSCKIKWGESQPLKRH